MSAEQSIEQTSRSETPKNNVPLIQEGRHADNPLSEREMDVARLLSTGASNSEIAHSLIISPHTVKVHLRNIFEKLEVNSRTEASMLLVQRGWLTVPGVEVPPVLDSTTETLVIPTLPPDPEPLPNAQFRLMDWQRLYFVGAFLLALVAFLLPSLRTRATTSPSLLSDAGQIGIPVAEVLSLPRWQQLTPLSEARSRMAIAFVDEKLVVIGGEGSGGKLSAAVNLFDLGSSNWRNGAELPTPVSNSAAAVISNTIYLAGGTEAIEAGESTKISNALLQWNINEEAWSKFADLPNPLAGAALVADNDSLYLIGGWDGQQMHDEVWRLTPSDFEGTTPTWQLLTRLETARAFLGAAVVDQKLYVVGGNDGQHDYNQNSYFDLMTGKWMEMAPFPLPRHGFGFVYDGSALFILGGDEVNPVAIHQRYDIGANEWTNFASPVQGVWRNLAAVSAHGRIYLMGGWSGDYLDNALEYQSSYRLLLPVISKDS